MTQATRQELIEGVLAGNLISFPTDTVPALAALPQKAPLIFAAKQRSQDKPLILMAADATELWDFVAGSREELLIWQQMAATYWPGAVTMVLPASDRVPKDINLASPDTVGLRVPNHAVAQAILARTGALATTSANKSGKPPLQTLEEIAAEFPHVLTLLPTLGGEPLASAMPSTVIKWIGNNWQILRLGAVTLKT
ncbi:L-threonylcarbamoyladenylate synthase [Synechocystis sp. PCC 7509]|uniref:L-threonylcarbamoyladenylate synthase n=1 Tax=Synechocystis sp. PCC 7509 TaxID=927677 RepID=UPI0002ACEDD0|nr:L-threonylcarbamoyladenylate synthase [Synechocystis sp. PCC 7509]